MKIILWDFDGTLAFREGMWSGTLAGLAQHYYPDFAVSVDSIRPHLQKGFPWHYPENPHDFGNAEQWWSSLRPLFINAFSRAGLPESIAQELSVLVQSEYTKVEYWSIYDDVESCLSELSRYGWKHVILSNHVPELPELVQKLGLSCYFEQVITSAKVGFEKPHSSIFKHATAFYPEDAKIWMVGDSYTADVEGAVKQGLPAILVRKKHELAEYCASNLHDVVEIITREVGNMNEDLICGS